MSAVQFSALKPQFDAAGVKLVGFGVEKLGYEDFIRGGFFDGPLFIDEERLLYTALNCRMNTWRNFWGLCGGQILKLYRLSQKQKLQNNMAGETSQLGGTFVLGPLDGALIFGHYQTPESFEPDMEAILTSLGIPIPPNYNVHEYRRGSGSGYGGAS